MSPIGQACERVGQRQLTKPVDQALQILDGRLVQRGLAVGNSVLQQCTRVTELQITEVNCKGNRVSIPNSAAEFNIKLSFQLDI